MKLRFLFPVKQVRIDQIKKRRVNMKKVTSILLAMMLMLTLVSCGNSSGETTSNTTSDTTNDTKSTGDEGGSANTGNYTIGFSVYDLSNEYFQSMMEGVEAAAEENGVTLITHDQKSSESELVTGATNLINQGVNALIVSPCKPEVMSTIVDLAKESNIPVIILDIGDGGSDKDAIVVSDMYGGGQIAGKYALSLLEADSVTEGEFAIIKCEESAVYAIQRGEGFKSIMEEAGFTLATELVANSDTTEAYNAMQDILTSYPDVKVIFAENDNMALGAASAIDEAGKTGEILVFGFDGNESAVEAILDGTMSGTIAQQPVEIGRLGIELAIQRINGEELEFDNPDTKEIYADVYLIDSTGEANHEFTVE